MDNLPLVWLLPIATFVLVIGFAWWSKSRTEEKLDDPASEKSSLAKDGPGPQPIR